MKRNTLYVLLALCTAVPFHALGQRTCGTGDHFQQALLKDPSLLQRTKDAKALSEQWLNKHPASTLKKTGTVITIPVVVHVIYENNAENISDAQVISQIDVLNRDFRKLNVDTGNVPIGFQGLAADVEVEFCLAVRDPNGNPTNGITRTPTTQTDFSNADPKSTAQGGKDGWPNNDYLNFWVCDLGGGLLGYATFPGGNPSQDGVVCLYTSIGEPPANPFGGSFNKGRTATHEIGHYLGLSHTFQGGCAGTTLSNCGSSGDGICDTPPTSSPNYGCPSVTQNSCSESPADENDMHMNYMDYVDDGCMNLFTYGQKSRMLSVLNTSRSSLQNSLGCMSLSVLDASVSLLAPTDTLCGSNQFAPKVMLHNFGSATLTGATINYQVDAGPISTYAWTGSLATLSSIEVTLPLTTASLGAHTFKAWTSGPNGGNDELSTNDSTNSSFTFMNGNSVSLTLDYGSFPAADKVTWDLTNSSGDIVSSGGGYTQNTVTLEVTCLEPGCYMFNMYDIVDNGVGSFSLVDVTGDTIVAQNDIFNYSFTFCVELPPLSVKETGRLEHLVAVYPNPTSGFVHLTSDLFVSGVEEIVVQNTIGQVVYSTLSAEVRSNSTQLDLTSLEGGVYFVTVRTATASITKKISLIR